METLAGIVIGIVATILVSRYYFLRTISKNMSLYKLFNSYVFDGIAPDVRKRLHFIFNDKEVSDLQQVVFLLANDGERAVSNIIDPVSIEIPPGIDVLDASILHRHPDPLQAEIHVVRASEGVSSSRIALQFPLLNKGEFFVFKLLLSGRISDEDLAVKVLADDLPRELSVKRLPLDAIREQQYKIEWLSVIIGLVFLAFPAWSSYWMHNLWQKSPELFPYPWDAYKFSWESLAIIAPGVLLFLFFGVIGTMFVAMAFFEGGFPPRNGPRFPLPKGLIGLVSPYRFESVLDGDEASSAVRGPAQETHAQS